VQDHRVAKRYASALFQSARAGGVAPAVEQDLALVTGLIQSNSDFRHFMVAPYASREARMGLLTRVFGAHVSPVTLQLLQIMLDKRRESEITAVYEEFVILRRAHDRVAHTVVTTAEPLDETQRQVLLARLSQVLDRQIEPEFNVDPNLIGGIRVKYENFVLDGSVRGALGRMKETLRINVLKQQA
jgi:F-type H+-transporting ATPase subunit delta